MSTKLCEDRERSEYNCCYSITVIDRFMTCCTINPRVYFLDGASHWERSAIFSSCPGDHLRRVTWRTAIEEVLDSEGFQYISMRFANVLRIKALWLSSGHGGLCERINRGENFSAFEYRGQLFSRALVWWDSRLKFLRRKWNHYGRNCP